MRKFTALAAGLLVSILGSTFAAFAMGVWVFQQTGSAAQYGVTLVLSLVPGILAAPVAGALVDRWNRRIILIVSDVVSTATILGLAVLVLAGVLRPWHVFIAVGIQSLVRSIQVPAVSSVVVLLAPEDQVARANGMVLLAQALGNTVGFAVGGVLLDAIGLKGVLLIDCATYVVNIVILLFITIPDPERTAAGSAGGGRLLSEIRQGWRYLATRRGLPGLVVFAAALYLYVGYADVLLTPMVLSFASAAALGLVLAFVGLGMVLGGVTLTTWGGPHRRVHALAGFALPLGFFLCLGALRPSVPLLVIAGLGFMFCSTVIDGTISNVLQVVVEPDMQGRAFASFSMVTQGIQCLSYAIAGPIADHYFEPLLRHGGPLAGTVGAVIGVGRGRGMAFLLLLIGALVVVTAVVGYLHPSLRTLPDRPYRAEHAAEPEVEPAVEPGVEPVPVARAMVAAISDGHDGERAGA